MPSRTRGCRTGTRTPAASPRRETETRAVRCTFANDADGAAQTRPVGRNNSGTPAHRSRATAATADRATPDRKADWTQIRQRARRRTTRRDLFLAELFLTRLFLTMDTMIRGLLHSRRAEGRTGRCAISRTISPSVVPYQPAPVTARLIAGSSSSKVGLVFLIMVTNFIGGPNLPAAGEAPLRATFRGRRRAATSPAAPTAQAGAAIEIFSSCSSVTVTR